MNESAKEWFERFPDLGKQPLFRLMIKLPGGNDIIIRAYEGPVQRPYGHQTLFCELDIKRPDSGRFVRLFARESFYCATPAGETIDGDYAKELAISLFATLDQDNEAFESYEQAQRDFVERFGEELRAIAEDRYGSF